MPAAAEPAASRRAATLAATSLDFSTRYAATVIAAVPAASLTTPIPDAACSPDVSTLAPRVHLPPAETSSGRPGSS